MHRKPRHLFVRPCWPSPTKGPAIPAHRFHRKAAPPCWPELPPQRAAMLALMCGTPLVEDDADPRVLFPVALDLLYR